MVEAAPFDTILAQHRGRAFPVALTEQLAIGGRLVIPVGEHTYGQALRKIHARVTRRTRRRTPGSRGIRPPDGRAGWAEDGRRSASNHCPVAHADKTPRLDCRGRRTTAQPEDPTFAQFIEALRGSPRLVLLGEASHGTSEFYRARATITARLIEEHGITIVAVGPIGPMRRLVDPLRAAPPGGQRCCGHRFERFLRGMCEHDVEPSSIGCVSQRAPRARAPRGIL